MDEKKRTRNIRLLLAYDGTDFSGWQRQPGQRTVQGAVERALEKLHKHPVGLAGAGRTDAGVHAAGQTAHFHTDIQSMAPDRFARALNGLLPQDVRVLRSQEERPDFHARFDAKARTYRYRLICGRRGLPQELRYGLQMWRHPRQAWLNAYARLLRGEMDCSIFAVPRDSSKSRCRYFFGAGFFIQGDALIFEITANAFLWKMVRSVLGTLLYYEELGLSPEAFREILLSGNRRLAGPTVPPQGLSLWKVTY
ncbi:MAG: tRNA pseudouridine(38-40) synthase TruA [Spirochaetaceae bacterium]|jgi:tRNA pseudouridine38-40 synthase|nr:tRNA pseudouridine(38-40) synthase TruA [Spirochaetaceae bacterium]